MNKQENLYINNDSYVGSPVSYALSVDIDNKGSLVPNEIAPLLFGNLTISYNYRLKPPTNLLLKLYSDDLDDKIQGKIRLHSDKIGTLRFKDVLFDSISIDDNFDSENISIYFDGYELVKPHDGTKKLLLEPIENLDVYDPIGVVGGVGGVEVVDDLVSNDVDKALSANQGRVLKGFIDVIDALLESDDVNLDELQELIDFIKQNKAILDTLTIGNIAGLQVALDSKSDKLVYLPTKIADFSLTDVYDNKVIPIGASIDVTIPDTFSSGKTVSFLVKDGFTLNFLLGNNVVDDGSSSLVHLGKKVVTVTNLDNEIVVL